MSDFWTSYRPLPHSPTSGTTNITQQGSACQRPLSTRSKCNLNRLEVLAAGSKLFTEFPKFRASRSSRRRLFFGPGYDQLPEALGRSLISADSIRNFNRTVVGTLKDR